MVVWWCIGPPWNIKSAQTALNNHETVHLKGIQAILNGSPPYIDAASSQYGPLIQKGAVWFMKNVGERSIESHREFWATAHFGGFLAITVLICLAFRPLVAASINLFVLLSPSFSFFKFENSTLVGLFGWANPLRYIAVLIIALSIGGMSRTHLNTRLRIQSLLVGICIALLGMVSQENLILSSITVVALVAIRGVTESIERSALFGCVKWGVAGTSLGILIYLFPYLRDGLVGQFVSNYFHIPLAVQSGYSNSAFVFSDNPCCSENMQYMPYFLFAHALTVLGGLVIVRKYACSTYHQDAKQVQQTWMVLSLWVGSTIVFGASLTRMDASHVAATSILLPVWSIPFFWLIARRRMTSWRTPLSIALTLIFFVVLVFAQHRSFLRSGIQEAANERFWGRFEQLQPKGNEGSFSLTFGGDFTSVEVSRFVNWLQELPKGPIYLDPAISPLVGDELSLYYFVGNLVPYPVRFDEQTMAISHEELAQNDASLRNNTLLMCGLVTSDVRSSTVDMARLGRNLFLAKATRVNDTWVYYLANPSC